MALDCWSLLATGWVNVLKCEKEVYTENLTLPRPGWVNVLKCEKEVYTEYLTLP
jgi:hypothetical protein